MNECTVLLVNDDSAVIAALHQALERVRHKLIVAPTAKAAIRTLTERQCGFNIVFLDLDLGLEGLHLLGALHTCCPRLPVVALTPWGDWELYEKAFLGGAMTLLDKPVSPDELSPMLRQLCSAARVPRSGAKLWRTRRPVIGRRESTRHHRFL